MVKTTLRRLRLAMDDDGLIGRVLASHTMSILYSLRDILWAVYLILVCLETYFRPQLRRLMMDEKAATMDRIWASMNRHMPSDQIHDPPSVIGDLLESGGDIGLVFILLSLPRAALWVCYKFLDWYVFTDFEKMERKLEEQKEELERAEKHARGEKTEDERREWLVERVTHHSWFNYFHMALFAMLFWDAGNKIKYDLSHEFSEHEVDKRRVISGLETVNLALINPWKELDPAQDGVLRDLVYIDHTIRNMIPTSLPGDDFGLYSDMIRYLETRPDISWRTFEEVEISATISSASSRRDIQPSEPKDLQKRMRKLSSHWHDLALAPYKPERWQDEADTVFLKPLISGHIFGGDDKGGKTADDSMPILKLTPEQAASADKQYRQWRTNRDRKAGYLQMHPPSPMAWVPITAEQREKYSEQRTFGETDKKCGNGMTVGKLVVETSTGRAWKPLFRSLVTEDIPFGWIAPGEDEGAAEDDARKYLEDMREEWDAADARRKEQQELMDMIKALMRKEQEEERERGAKIEL